MALKSSEAKSVELTVTGRFHELKLCWTEGVRDTPLGPNEILFLSTFATFMDLQRFGVERFEQRLSEVKVAADLRRLGPTRRSTGRSKKARRRRTWSLI